jgi:CheY-like chemotaxis protein
VNHQREEESTTRRPTVLICEDEASLRELVRIVVNGDVQFAEAEDGLTAAELVQELKPDIVVLDLMLPGRHGLDVLRDIREDDELAHTRVVAITAGSYGPEEALAEGADRFLRKPFDPDELRAAIAELLAA